MPLPKALQKKEFRSTNASALQERVIVGGLAICALLTVMVTVGITFMLLSQSSSFFFPPAKHVLVSADATWAENLNVPLVADGYDVKAATAPELKEKALAGEPDLIILQTSKTDSAKQLVEELTQDNRTRPIPLIVITDEGFGFADATSSFASTVDPAQVFEKVALHAGTNERVTFTEFLTGGEWSALTATNVESAEFGIWPLLSGTFRVTFIAMLIALPLGLVTAVYLSEFASARVRSFLKPTLEIIAGIPTVVLGYFAILVITPALQSISNNAFDTFNVTSAGIAVGILCLPMVCSLSEDAMRAVPDSLRAGAYGLGCTPFETAVKVVVPAALSGIVSAFLLAFSRAVGETMVVALAAGTLPTLAPDPTGQGQTMTGFIVEMIKSENEFGTVQYYSLYAVAITLFIITFAMTLLGQLVRRRFRESYQ